MEVGCDFKWDFLRSNPFRVLTADEAALSYKEQSYLLVTGNLKHFPDCPFAVSPAQLKEKLDNL